MYDFYFLFQSHFDDAVVTRVVRPVKRQREDSSGRVRSSSRTPRDESGIRDVVVRYIFLFSLCLFF